MIEVQLTDTFAEWVETLRDRQARIRIADRLVRLSRGNLGDAKSVGGGVSEMRIDCGPGYRVYFTRRGQTIIILLCGGEKGSQDRDIRRAQEMAEDL